MATNIYFNNYQHSNTQNLVNDLIVESIKQKGFDVNYLPREIVNYDEILGEGETYTFANNYVIEMYMENVENWGGTGDMFSKFGLQITDEATLVVSKSRFMTVMDGIRTMPHEGDLIYLSFSQSFLQIKKMEYDSSFWPQGQNYVWQLKTELFSFSGEEFATGNTTIQNEIARYPVSANTSFMPDDSDELSLELPLYVDFSENNPYLS
jgi:hypothetical protein